MPISSGAITFDGVNQAQFLLGSESWGTAPDTFQLWIQPQTDAVPAVGTLAWQFAGTGCYRSHCLVDSVFYKQTTRGVFQILTIKDRRWKWQLSNVTHFKKDDYLQSVATMLFNIMGELGADVSAIDPTLKVYVDFDHANAADELEALLYRYGYCVSPNGDGPAKVWAMGVGVTISADNDLTGLSFSLSPAVLPYSIKAIANKTMVQSKLLMEPVGEDSDDTIKPIDSLSYKPSGGWSSISDWKKMVEIPDQTDRNRALKSVGKWFRVKSQADATQNIAYGTVNYVAGEIAVSDYTQLLPLFDKRLETDVLPDGSTKPMPSFCEAIYYDDDIGRNTFDSVSGQDKITRIDKDWTLSPTTGVIRFSKQILVRSMTSNTLSPATVYFTCSYSVDSPTTNQKDRMYYGITPGGVGNIEIDADDLQRQLICKYDSSTVTSITSLTDNQADIQTEMTNRLNATLRKYTTQARKVLFLRQIYPFTVDGINQQIVWKAGMMGSPTDPPFSTTVSQYMESHPHLTRRKERERRNNLRRRKSTEGDRIRDRNNFNNDSGAGI